MKINNFKTEICRFKFFKQDYGSLDKFKMQRLT